MTPPTPTREQAEAAARRITDAPDRRTEQGRARFHKDARLLAAYVLAGDTERLREALEAARELYERVEMDESVGICLSERVSSMRLGAALAALAEVDV